MEGMTFQDHFCLEITVVGGASPLREVGRGPSELLPSPLSLPPSHRGLGNQPTALPLTAPLHSLPLFLLESLSHPAPDTLLAGPVVVWIRQPGIFSLQRAGGRRLEGRGGIGSLVLGRGSLLAMAPGRPFLIFSPFPRVTSNHVFLCHALPTRLGSETSHFPPPHTQAHLLSRHKAGGGPSLGRGETQGQGKRAEASVLNRRCRPTPQGTGDREMVEPQAPLPLLKQGMLLAALCLETLGSKCPPAAVKGGLDLRTHPPEPPGE